jgi:hypothetical protein
MTIVTYTHGYKRPPKKKSPALAVEGPAFVIVIDRKRLKALRQDRAREPEGEVSVELEESFKAEPKNLCHLL